MNYLKKEDRIELIQSLLHIKMMQRKFETEMKWAYFRIYLKPRGSMLTWTKSSNKIFWSRFLCFLSVNLTQETLNQFQSDLALAQSIIGLRRLKFVIPCKQSIGGYIGFTLFVCPSVDATLSSYWIFLSIYRVNL